jgi:serine/threonine-protein kinase
MRHLDGFEILSETSQTPFSKVYKAREIKGNRLVFLRFYPPSRNSPEPYWRWRTEISILAGLVPPTFQQILDVGQTNEGDYYQVLEYFEGTSLDQILAGQKYPWTKALELARKVALALCFPHCLGIAHCNLRPSNIVLTRKESFKIVGFEYGRILERRPKADLVDVPLLHLPPDPITPEQRAGITGQIGPPTDIYAWGTILYQLMNWLPTFPLEDVQADIRSAAFRADLAPTGLLPDGPPELDAILTKCLQENPHDRYPWGNALWDDLKEVPELS